MAPSTSRTSEMHLINKIILQSDKKPPPPKNEYTFKDMEKNLENRRNKSLGT